MFKNNPAGGKQKPDAVSFDPRRYWELKPITHRRSARLKEDDRFQLSTYSTTLSASGFQAGDQRRIAPSPGVPMGLALATDGNWYILWLEQASWADPTLRGLVYYYATDLDPQRVPQTQSVPIPQNVPGQNLQQQMRVNRKVILFDETTQLEIEYQRQIELVLNVVRGMLIVGLLLSRTVDSGMQATVAVVSLLRPAA